MFKIKNPLLIRISLLFLLFFFGLLFVVLIVRNDKNLKSTHIAEKQNAVKSTKDRKMLENYLESFHLPNNFTVLNEDFKPAFHGKMHNLGTEDCLFSCQVDYGASLVVNFKLDNLNRERVFQTFVQALGLNLSDHSHSTDQRLNGNQSPIYAGTFDLMVEPFDDFSTGWLKPCSVIDQQITDYETSGNTDAAYNARGAYDQCRIKQNGLRSATTAKFTMHLPY